MTSVDLFTGEKNGNSCCTFQIHQDLLPQSNKLQLLLHYKDLFHLFANTQRALIHRVILYDVRMETEKILSNREC